MGSSFHPETPDEKLVVLNLEARIFLYWQELNGLRGGVHKYAAQVTSADEQGGKRPFPNENVYFQRYIRKENHDPNS